MVAKLVVWDRDRDAARARMRRALDEYVVEGVQTLIPLHRLIMEAPEFARGETCAGLVEDVWPTMLPEAAAPVAPGSGDGAFLRAFTTEIDGRRHEVRVHVPVDPAGEEVRRRIAERRHGAGAAAGAGSVTSPMQGTVLKVNVADGDAVEAGQVLAVVEAMKMENEIVAPRVGVVASVAVQAGQPVQAGQAICELEEAGR